MKALYASALLAIAVASVASLVSGADYLGIVLPGGLPAGNAISALGLVSAAGVPALLSASSSALRVAALVTLGAATAYRLDVFPASTLHPTFFLLGGCSDDDSGGWLLGEIEQNMKLCIGEKTRKVAPMRHKYPEWWLVLIDHIGFGLDDFDRECFKDQVKIEHGWHKVVLLDPRNHTRAIEI